jgi:hypothetical protein
VAVIGSPYWRHDVANPGAAYEFGRTNSRWAMTTQLLPPDFTAVANMGHSVAIGEGYTLIGAPGVQAAYLFQQGQLLQTLAASDGEPSDQFGYSVSASGHNLAVGAPQASPGGLTYAGAVYLYRQ